LFSAAGTAGQLLTSGGAGAPTWSSALNSVSIGATTASTGKFTTLESGSLKITGGTPSVGMVLTSDASGNATWGTNGLYTLNGISSAGQTFAATATSLSNAPAITSSGSVHTFNIPLASAAATVTAGLVSNSDYTTFNNKIGGSGTANYITKSSAAGTITASTVIYETANKIGLGTTTPTAILQLKAGTATANTAPLKLTAGTNLTTAEAGAIEFDGTNLYFTNASNVRQTIATVSSAIPQDVIDEFSSAAGVTGTLTASKTTFALSQTPNSKSKVKMLINGIFISTTAYSLSGSTITYNPTNNGSKVIATTDRVQFFYSY
jgi:hypothetical protein